MRIFPGKLRLTLAAMMSAMAAGVCAAGDAPATSVTPAADASQPAVQIDEIWVRGKSLTELIVDAEDELFKLYNKANKNSDYDIHCGTMSLSSGSMIMIRKCVPGFIVYNSYSALNNTVSFGTSGYTGCSSPIFVPDSNGEMSFYGGGGSCYGTYSYPTSYMSSGYVAPSAGLLLMERGPAYANNVVRVVSSDPGMVKMANNLVAMYNELEALQLRYVDARKAGQKVRKELRGGPKMPVGPRVL